MDARESTLAVIRAMAAAVEENRQHLTQLDSAIGDADHGTNLHRGFQAALEKLNSSEFGTPGEVLKAVSTALIGKVGGAAGPLYGTAFLRAATAVGDKEELSPEDVAAALEAALEGIKQRGKAEVGEKTIVDALSPAAAAARDRAAGGGSSAAEVLRAAAAAAREGVDSTVELRAKKGRAAYLGQRSVGHPDPGAASTHLLLEAAASELEGGA